MRRVGRFPCSTPSVPEAVISLTDFHAEPTALIGVDWGTSNMRVMRLAAGGRILEQRADARGAGELEPNEFGAVLQAVAGDWLGSAPVLICGMAGARGRWREAPYVACPARLEGVAAGLVRPESTFEVLIVPGVAEFGADGLSDVMRGEETQVLGLADSGFDGWVIGPGTHSKWIRMEGGAIISFRTFATGELFAAVRERSILAGGAAPGDGADDEAFRQGVERGLAEPALSAALFSVRVGLLAGRLTTGSVPDYLSGLLIGAEIGAGRGAVRAGGVTLIGAADLVRRYALALSIAGLEEAEICDATAVTARGLWRIWEARS